MPVSRYLCIFLNVRFGGTMQPLVTGDSIAYVPIGAQTLIIQIGAVPYFAASSFVKTFNVPFPNALLLGLGSWDAQPGTTVNVGGYAKESMTLFKTGSPASNSCHWIAIGY